MEHQMAVIYPVIGEWYRRPSGNLFEVVALDEEDGTIEVQHFDGTVEEIDMDAWPDMLLESVEAPEDWSGSVDIEPEDYHIGLDETSQNDWSSPLDYLDRAD